MHILLWIILSCFIGGLLSVTAAAIVTFNTRTHLISHLVSYAVGAMLGAVFLEILPQAFKLTNNIEMTTLIVLFGILLFFVLEKLLLWRHCHGDHCEVHDIHHEDSYTKVHQHNHDQGRSGSMIMVGDLFHNFVDGILIGSAFMVNVSLGIVTALAIIAHEIPQEVGNFLILLHSGYKKKEAFIFNLLASFSTILGGLLAYFVLESMMNWVPFILALAASSMIYVSIADLIPGLHKKTELRSTAFQVVLIVLGISSVAITQWIVEG
ncbi:MAG: ZIP family metal transporter [Candidatus Methylopumilus sp.]|nr:ZIP family metal transporter [Candidatus Methylopumilus sp.]